MTKIKIFLTMLFAGGIIFAQQSSLVLTQGTPSPVINISVNNLTGTPQPTTQCFWVVAIYPIGESVPIGPQCIFNAVQSGSILINWNAVSQATGYHVLVNTTTVNPLTTGNCTSCRIVTNQATTTFTWNLGAGGAYTPNSAKSAISNTNLDNITFTQSRVINDTLCQFLKGIQFSDGTILTSTTGTITSATQLVDGNGLPVINVATVASQVNSELFTTGATGTPPLLGPNSARADANSGQDFTSLGTGSLSFWTGNKAKRQFQIIDTAGGVINFITATGNTTTNPPSFGIGTTTDVNVGMTFITKGLGAWTFTTQTATNQGFTFTPSIGGGVPNIIFGDSSGNQVTGVDFIIPTNGGLAGDVWKFWFNGTNVGQPILTLADAGGNVTPTNGIIIRNPSGVGTTGPQIFPSAAGAMNISSNGANPINLFTGGNITRKQFVIADTVGTIINRLSVTGNITTLSPSIGIDTTTDANVPINLIPKGNSPVTEPGIQSIGTKFTITGCGADTTIGGASVGQFTSRTTGACTVVITMGGATGLVSTNGWACGVSNETTANLIRVTANNTTTATVSGTTVTGDVIVFNCAGY